MRDLFPGYYMPSDERLAEVWKEGIFVLDTNMLLHVYRYSPETRDRFFETLSKLNHRIWIPYQVAAEYQERRLTVIDEQARAYKSVLKLMDTTLQFLKEGLEPYKKRHAFIDTVQLIEKVAAAITSAKAEVQKAKNAHPDLKANDPFREKIDELLNGKIGSPYSKEELKEKCKEAEYRLENKIAPGYKDDNKKGLKKYGDVILWFQMIDHARSEQKPVIFITDDTKPDWWLSQEESKGPIKPRPELIQEMFLETKMPFWMYEGYEFMEKAQQYLKLEEKPEVIEEIREVGQEQAVGNSIVHLGSGDVSASTNQVLNLVSSPTIRALSDIANSPATRMLQDYINSPAYKLAQDYLNSPTYKILQDYLNSPTYKMLQDYLNSPTFKTAFEMQRLLSQHLRNVEKVSGVELEQINKEDVSDDSRKNNNETNDNDVS